MSSQTASTDSFDVLILGAGVSGMSAASKLAAAGQKVCVLERRGFAGGRTFDFTDKASSECLDNGQHLLLGCYVHTLNYLSRVSAQDRFFRAPLDIELRGRDGRGGRFKVGSGPIPFHVMEAFFNCQAFSLRTKLGFLLGGLAFLYRQKRLARKSTAWLLERMGQTQEAIEVFWRPFVLATLNADIDTAPAHLLQRVLKQAFLGKRTGMDMLVPNTGLGQALIDPGVAYVQDHGGSVCVKAKVDAFDWQEGKVRGVVLADGRKINATSVISTLPPDALERVLGRSGLKAWWNLSEMDPSPIVSFHLWFDPMPKANSWVLGFYDSPLHWLFQTSRFYGQDPKGHWTLLISASDDWMGLTQDASMIRIEKELRQVLPGTWQIVRAVRVQESKATWNFAPAKNGQFARRPGIKSPYPGLLMAGDWTDTGLPCTIESAAQSGHGAAQMLMDCDRIEAAKPKDSEGIYDGRDTKCA